MRVVTVQSGRGRGKENQLKISQMVDGGCPYLGWSRGYLPMLYNHNRSDTGVSIMSV